MLFEEFSAPTRRCAGRVVLASAVCVCAAMLMLVSGCRPVKLVATARIPEPLIVKIPVTVALLVPPEFAQYVHKEERWGTEYHIDIGKAQTEAISRLMNAMFQNVVFVEDLNEGSRHGQQIAAILEPVMEEYAFVTPRDAGSPFFAVSIKYRVNVYLPDGKLADSWGFTGYGTAPAGGLSNTEPLVNATALAMRDAGAKLAVEFREQAVIRGLLPEEPGVDESGDAPAEQAPADDARGSDPFAPPPTPSQNEEESAPASPPEPSAAPESDEGAAGEESGGDEESVVPQVEAFAARTAHHDGVSSSSLRSGRRLTL